MQDPAAASNQLNRELLRWIQSLDLAFSIKNVKRDFANGFLVAEIMSRYYDRDVSMHSYDNGIGVKVKKDNWEQLLKVFHRVPDLEPLTTRSEIDAVIHCQNGAAVGFITKLYQCLTKRTIQTTVANAPPAAASAPGLDDSMPPYAKPTGAALIRDKMRTADVAETRDEGEVQRKVRDIHAQHEEQLQLDRLLAAGDATPERFPALRSASKATVVRGATRPVRNDEGPALATQHVVKEVQIKSMNEKSLEKLRVTREAKASDQLQSQQQQYHQQSGGAAFDRHSTSSLAAAGELVQRRRPGDLLNESVARAVPAPLLVRVEQRAKDKFESFLDALHDGQLVREDEGAELLAQILTDDAAMLAQACLDFPRDLGRVVGVLAPFLSENDEDHALFLAAHGGLVQLGAQCVQRDPTAAMLLLTDHVLPRVTPLLRSHATKRAPLLRLVYAFAGDSVLAHVQVIKRLRDALESDIPLFVHALSVLLFLETQLDATLVDLYHYYCCIGLETPCEKLRAACLSMLVPLLAHDVTLVADLLPRLTLFSARHAWWEVKAQLLVVAAAFLHRAASSSSRDLTESIELALTIVEREFHPQASLNLRRVGLAHLAKALAQYQELVPLFVDVLLSLPLEVQRQLLVDDDTDADADADGHARALPVRGSSGAHYSLPLLPPQWDSLAVAKQLFYERQHQEHADAASLQVLAACVAQLAAQRAVDALRALFEQTRGFVVRGLLEPAACASTAELLRTVVASGAAPAARVLTDAAVVDALQRLVSRNVEDVRQQTAVRLLHDVHAAEPAPVRRCVELVQAQCDAAVFRASLFSIAFELS
ncbi:hypothetical protein P43SY_003391 [Pythium insidiosum]|uniref:Spermatogenesis-associated protein 4 n=1 Tax=Pythium insidiosum TaxID=114742 RepID=A0AAD5Q8S7_PYTIN|nr:hypothetical protein P43SY_003391 [Pythium insidiosum]